MGGRATKRWSPAPARKWITLPGATARVLSGRRAAGPRGGDWV